MRKLLLAVTMSALTISPSFAKGKKMDGAKFEQVKAKVLKHMDAKVKMIQENRNCVAGATDKKSLRACRKSGKAKMDAFRKENVERRRQMRKKRQERKSQQNNN